MLPLLLLKMFIISLIYVCVWAVLKNDQHFYCIIYLTLTYSIHICCIQFWKRESIGLLHCWLRKMTTNTLSLFIKKYTTALNKEILHSFQHIFVLYFHETWTKMCIRDRPRRLRFLRRSGHFQIKILTDGQKS